MNSAKTVIWPSEAEISARLAQIFEKFMMHWRSIFFRYQVTKIVYLETSDIEWGHISVYAMRRCGYAGATIRDRHDAWMVMYVSMMLTGATPIRPIADI